MLLTIIVLFSLILLSGCSSSVDEAPMEQKSRVTVDLSTFQVEVEDLSRGSRTTPTLLDVSSRLSFAVLNSEGGQVVTIHQDSEDDDFGSVEMELYPGSYKMVAVAHNGDDDASISSVTSAVLPGTTITDSFTGVQDLTVESNQDCTFNMSLKRITSAFILKLNDIPPVDVKEIEVVVNVGGSEPTSLDVNPSTGLASKNWKQTCIIPIADISNETPIYFVGMLKQASVTVKATAYDANGIEIISHTINGVPLAPNQKTIATGTFFQSSGSGTFTIETTWGDDKNIEY